MKKMIRNMMIGALAVGLVGCVPDTPIASISPQERAVKMDSLRREYTNYTVNANHLIQGAINAKYLSQSSQTNLYSQLKHLNDTVVVYAELRNKSPEEVLKLGLNDEQKEWFSLLEKNVMGSDGNPPEIQKVLEKKYPGFKADAIHSEEEKGDDLRRVLDIILTHPME